MEWSELVRKYKDGSAAPQERALVEEELEKQQQLNDLLYSEIEREVQNRGSSARVCRWLRTGTMRRRLRKSYSGQSAGRF